MKNSKKTKINVVRLIYESNIRGFLPELREKRIQKRFRLFHETLCGVVLLRSSEIIRSA